MKYNDIYLMIYYNDIYIVNLCMMTIYKNKNKKEN